jgi:hypothetical protein
MLDHTLSGFHILMVVGISPHFSTVPHTMMILIHVGGTGSGWCIVSCTRWCVFPFTHSVHYHSTWLTSILINTSRPKLTFGLWCDSYVFIALVYAQTLFFNVCANRHHRPGYLKKVGTVQMPRFKSPTSSAGEVSKCLRCGFVLMFSPFNTT